MDRITAVMKRETPEYVFLELAKKEKEIIQKKILFKNFVKLLENSSEISEKSITIGKLPYGYYNGSICEDGFKVIVSIPSKVFLFQYYEDAYVIPFPRLVFYFSYQDGKMITAKCFAAKDEVLMDQSKLYHYPFGNVYSDGKICFGGNSIPKCFSLSEIDEVIKIFYGTPSNNDLWCTKYCKDKYTGLRVLIEELSGKEFFPEETLLECHKTVGDLLKEYKIINGKRNN